MIKKMYWCNLSFSAITISDVVKVREVPPGPCLSVFSTIFRGVVKTIHVAL